MKFPDFTWNSVIGFPEAVALALLFMAAGLWLAWHNSAGVKSSLRVPLFGLRAFALGLVAVLWLNPGRWVDDSLHPRRDWLVLVDRSASMKADQSTGVTRWQAAVTAASRLAGAGSEKGSVRILPFSTQLEAETAAPGQLRPDGNGTDLGRPLASALDQNPDGIAGMIVISDGRQNRPAKLDEVALRAQGRGIPIHAIALGGNWGSRDLALTAMPKQSTSFHGQPAKITARIENRGLGPIKPRMILAGPDGKEIESREVMLENGASQTVTFEVSKVPAGGADYTVKTAPWPGEDVLSNNVDTVHVNVLDSKLRILLLEGAPYWDSKFLAELLRQQDAIDVLTVHRLNEERFFRVETTGAEALQTPDSMFPADARELRRYDLIVFGKGADGFLTKPRIAALQGFVRDQGGAVLFARGKSYSGRFEPLEPLEPVEWGDSMSGGFHLVPLPDTGANLFGGVLPAAEDRIWSALPPLEDVHAVARLKPFTRVLAEGTTDGLQARIPLLAVRRFGRGMVATVNADGLWRWDFRPDIREQGPFFRAFWIQLMQWCATYSDFRPGQDFAVHLSQAAGRQGEAVRAVIDYRGPLAPEPKPFLKITRDGADAGETAATLVPGSDDSRQWAAIITPEQPGYYQVRVVDPSRPGKEEGSAILAVQPPPGESDDLRPAPESLATLARESGGTVFSPAEAGKLADQLWTEKAAPAGHAKLRWESLWPRWWVALLAGLLFGGEWWKRRREGLS